MGPEPIERDDVLAFRIRAHQIVQAAISDRIFEAVFEACIANVPIVVASGRWWCKGRE